jgi:hypothetical protein
VICLAANRPALQIGRHQVIGYDTAWLSTALKRAAAAAERDDFPFLDEIRDGVVHYLENQCPLRMLPIQQLFARMRRMLERIGCEIIAAKLEPLAPPVTVSLVETAREAGNGFELAFFGALRGELEELRGAGAEEVSFTGLRECALILRGAQKWNRSCEVLLGEITGFIENFEDGPRATRPLHLQVAADA